MAAAADLGPGPHPSLQGGFGAAELQGSRGGNGDSENYSPPGSQEAVGSGDVWHSEQTLGPGDTCLNACVAWQLVRLDLSPVAPFTRVLQTLLSLSFLTDKAT